MVCVHMRPDITSVKCLINKDFNVQDFDVYIHRNKPLHYTRTHVYVSGVNQHSLYAQINLYITLVHMCMYLV